MEIVVVTVMTLVTTLLVTTVNLVIVLTVVVSVVNVVTVIIVTTVLTTVTAATILAVVTGVTAVVSIVTVITVAITVIVVNVEVSVVAVVTLGTKYCNVKFKFDNQDKDVITIVLLKFTSIALQENAWIFFIDPALDNFFHFAHYLTHTVWPVIITVSAPLPSTDRYGHSALYACQGSHADLPHSFIMGD